MVGEGLVRDERKDVPDGNAYSPRHSGCTSAVRSLGFFMVELRDERESEAAIHNACPSGLHQGT